MAKTTSSDAFASALSLLVITLGAVSAALIVMCIGMYVTIISVDTSTKVQVDAKHATPDRALVSTLEGPADVKPRRLTDLRDALFHEGLDALGEGGAGDKEQDGVTSWPRTYLSCAPYFAYPERVQGFRRGSA